MEKINIELIKIFGPSILKVSIPKAISITLQSSDFHTRPVQPIVNQSPTPSYNNSTEPLVSKVLSPFSVEENTLASDILTQMNKKKITSAFVFKKGNKRKIIGVLHIHHLLENSR